jgi:hypothetical protein
MCAAEARCVIWLTTYGCSLFILRCFIGGWYFNLSIIVFIMLQREEYMLVQQRGNAGRHSENVELLSRLHVILHRR